MLSLIRSLSIVLVATSIGLAFGYLTFLKKPGVFESTARILLPGRNASAVTEGIRELTNSGSLGQAFAEHALSRFTGLRSSSDPGEQIRENLRIVPADDAPGVVELHYRAADPQECRAALEAVLAAYMEEASKGTRQEILKTTETVQEARRALQSLYLRDGPVTAAPQNPAAHAGAAEGLERQRLELLAQHNELQRRLETVEKALATGQGADEILRDGAARPVPLASPLTGLSEETLARLAALRAEERTLAQKLGPEHPKLKALRTEIELLTRYPEEQARLLAEERLLLDQYGPNHPKVKDFQKKMRETLGSNKTTPDTSPPVGPAPEAQLSAEIERVKTAIENNREQQARLNAAIEAAKREPVPQSARVDADESSSDAQLQRVKSAIERLAKLNSREAVAAAYVVAAPGAARRLSADPGPALLASGTAGMVAGILLALLVNWAIFRGRKTPA